MMRRIVLTAAVTGSFAGALQAQLPAIPAPPAQAAAKDGQAEPGVMTLRVAGKPDRKVKVISSSKTIDGRTVSDVIDVATGERITVTDSSKPQTTPAAKPRTNDPLLNGASTAPAVMASTGTPAPAAEKPGLLRRPVTKSVSKPSMTTTASASPAPAAPTAAKPTTMMAPATVPTAPAMLPTATKASSVPVKLESPKPVADLPMPMPGGAIMPGGNGPARVILPIGYVPPEFRMKSETASSVSTLQTSSRPTERMDAATALAEGRYGSQRETKMLLAASAMHDPAPAVRVHCINCLSKLGYNEPEYVAYLRTCGTSTNLDPTVHAAAATALMKLQPK
jgi:hypothetical protein